MKLGLVKGKGFLDWLIRCYTGSDYSHAFLFEGNTKIEAIAPVGVRKANLTDYSPKSDIDVYDILLPEPKKKKMWEYMNSQIGKKYDYKGVLHFVLPFWRQSKYRFFCSELIAEAMAYAGVILAKKPEEYTPGDLSNLTIVKYEKTLKQEAK